MFEQISALVKQYGQQVVVDNPDIPNENNNAVLTEATRTITGGMQNMLAGGGLQDIISMFTGGGGASDGRNQSSGIAGMLKNPMVSMMVGHLISKLVGKFNMSHAQASQVSNNLIPSVLNGLVTRTASNDPSDSSFDLNDLIGSLTGGNTATSGFNFQGPLNQFTGGGNGNGGGGFDLRDIISQVTEGAQQNQERQAKGGGGITDLIKGFFN
jgi:hypothetical protein